MLLKNQPRKKFLYNYYTNMYNFKFNVYGKMESNYYKPVGNNNKLTDYQNNWDDGQAFLPEDKTTTEGYLYPALDFTYQINSKKNAYRI